MPSSRVMSTPSVMAAVVNAPGTLTAGPSAAFFYLRDDHQRGHTVA